MDAKRDGLREFALAGKRSEESPRMRRQFPTRLRPYRPLGGHELTMSEDHGVASQLPGCQPRVGNVGCDFYTRLSDYFEERVA